MAMKCAEFLKTLYRDDAFEACFEHIKSCRDCAAKYSREFDLEGALLRLNEIPDHLDIVKDVKNSLAIKTQNRKKLSLTRKLVWAVTGTVVSVAIYLFLPTCIAWLSRSLETISVFSIFSSFPTKQNIDVSGHLEGLINPDLLYVSLIIMVAAICYLIFELKGAIAKIIFSLNR
jgi:hypothetical protein